MAGRDKLELLNITMPGAVVARAAGFPQTRVPCTSSPRQFTQRNKACLVEKACHMKGKRSIAISNKYRGVLVLSYDVH